MIAPTGVRVRFNAGTTLKLYSLTDGRQKSSGKPGFFGGGGRAGGRDKAHDASGGHDPEQPTLLYSEQQTSSIFQSYKSAIKNRRLEKSIPDVDSIYF